MQIEQAAIGINIADTYFQTGLYPPPSWPFIVGEAAGTVTKLAKGTTGWKIGDRVAYESSTGAYAETAKVPEEAIIRLPIHQLRHGRRHAGEGNDRRISPAPHLKGKGGRCCPSARGGWCASSPRASGQQPDCMFQARKMKMLFALEKGKRVATRTDLRNAGGASPLLTADVTDSVE
ncbi:MAG: alcohol dehydrogenase catalytic domain-containing protein [Hyphomicrobiales bacterium]|nr:alcohol dehydrogenase catalytic domain-containing protein [Hyphomicrobiales bacterium]